MGKSLRHAIEINSPSKSEKDLNQIDKFKRAAEELGCDDDEEAFKAKFKKLTEVPPPESVEKRKTSKRRS